MALKVGEKIKRETIDSILERGNLVYGPSQRWYSSVLSLINFVCERNYYTFGTVPEKDGQKALDYLNQLLLDKGE